MELNQTRRFEKINKKGRKKGRIFKNQYFYFFIEKMYNVLIFKEINFKNIL